MITQIKIFEKNALALSLDETFTETDVVEIEQLFEEKFEAGYEHVNLLLKVKDMSILKRTDFKAFIHGEAWGFKHFRKLGRCAVVAHSDFIKAVVNVESKVLHIANAAFEEKYFDLDQLDEALSFIDTDK
ncbi:STAS/SEC14 domain-containing protein [Chitinophagaceae bacterium 26-R-25]|nr:STAS/SEC14 domain-containing protein [Chitinophagaceae bacterium 26-R-25]